MLFRSDAAVGFSLILREFITVKTEDPTLYETQEEFNRRVDALDSLPAQFQEPVKDLLDKLARMKYEPPTKSPKDAVNELANETVQIIKQIDQFHEKPEEETDVVKS